MNIKPVICHITTIHPSKDVRIFHKECKTLAGDEFEVKFLVGNGKSERIDNIEIIGIPISYIHRLQRIIKAPRVLRKEAEKLQADFYHFHDPEFLPAAKKMAKKGFKVIYDAHEDVPKQVLSKFWIPKIFRNWLSTRILNLEKSACPHFVGVITATDYIQKRFLNYNANTISIKNYPLPEFLSIEVSDEKERIVAYVGGLSHVRGAREMVKAVENIDCTLLLGGKFQPPQLRDEIAELSAWQKVKELGYIEREEVKKIYAKSQVGLVLLHPIINYVDALPVKLFEYMAAGLPVICTDTPLWREIVEDANCGILVDPFNQKQTEDALRKLLDDKELSKTLGQNGRNAVIEKYSWQNEGKKLVEFYKNLLG